MLCRSVLFVLSVLVAAGHAEDLPPTCNHTIYCQGPVLHHVQMAQIFPDSKTFVDMRLLYPEQEIYDDFERLLEETGGSPTRDQLQDFVSVRFEDGNELDNYTLPDFVSEPKFIDKINDEELRQFAKDVVSIWPSLARKVRPEVFVNSSQYSLIPLKNAFIVPGGRFKETYYWDTYWIIRGLLISEMDQTAKGMLDNFIYLVNGYGHIPNGARVYYEQRSQPPLLTHMVSTYINYTDDLDWLRTNIDTLAKELTFWQENRIVTITRKGKDYKLYRYNARSSGPRPESYREDVNTAAYFPDEQTQQEVYINLKSAAESGWDFSGRWIFDENGGNNANLSFINTPRVIPVDLNAFLCGAFAELSKLYLLLNNTAEATYWSGEYATLQQSIYSAFWNDTDGVWYDLDLERNIHRTHFYPSNLAPLWSKCYLPSKQSISKILTYLNQSTALNYLGGTPTSVENTGEQWDLPNAWPPLQDLIILGLVQTGNKDATALARTLAQRWVTANYRGYMDSKEMYEKYDAQVPGQYGGGGEYTVQPGFGWTNGVVLEFLDKFAKDLTADVSRK